MVAVVARGPAGGPGGVGGGGVGAWFDGVPWQLGLRRGVGPRIVFVLVFTGFCGVAFFLRMRGPQPGIFVVSAPLFGGSTLKKRTHEKTSQ